MKTQTLELTKELKSMLKNGNIPASAMIGFLLANGFKSNRPAEQSSISDCYKAGFVISGLSLDYEFAHIELAERERIPLESVKINDDEIYVSSSSTVFVNMHPVRKRSLENILHDIKQTRKRCRDCGVTFSAPSKSDIYALWEKYIEDYSAYMSIYRRAKEFWERNVANGLHTGLYEVANKPESGSEKYLYRSAPISRIESLVHRLEEIKAKNLEDFQRIAI